ncbi:MAG TPA: hypothetical protein VFR58_02895 [Flavisolibacter sp.]|nr:hypothetical protein [Flavisolibacter sp.]
MKTVFAVLFFLPLSLLAQDTCKLKKTTDPFTHETKVSTGFVPFSANGVQFSLSIDATPTEIDFFIWIKDDSKCFDDASMAQINYEGERLKANLKNTGSMNCEGAFHFSFRNSATTPSQLQRLTDKRISSIKLTGNNKTVTDIVFSEEQKQQFLRMAACVVREAKTLVKK